MSGLERVSSNNGVCWLEREDSVEMGHLTNARAVFENLPKEGKLRENSGAMAEPVAEGYLDDVVETIQDGVVDTLQNIPERLLSHEGAAEVAEEYIGGTVAALAIGAPVEGAGAIMQGVTHALVKGPIQRSNPRAAMIIQRDESDPRQLRYYMNNSLPLVGRVTKTLQNIGDGIFYMLGGFN